MNKPLADRIRPTELDDVVGQRHLLEKGKALRSLIDSGDIPNLIFYGPSGVGKTTVASIIASKTNRSLRRLNGTTASTQDIKDIVSELDTFSAPNGILLYLDEIQYFNKRQQQSLLEFIENGKITLIASTTENPYFYIYPAILSRSTVFEFKAVESEDIIPAVKRGFNILSEEYQVELDIDEEVLKRISVGCGGDVRKSLNSVENCFFATPTVDGKKHIELELAKQLVQKSAVRYDKELQINDYVHISVMSSVSIGDNVLMASHIYIADNSHGFYGGGAQSSPDIPPIKRDYKIAPISIGNNVWIGEGVVIMPGVIIGDGSVIGANSTVTKSIPPNSIAVGQPAKVIKLFDRESQQWIMN